MKMNKKAQTLDGLQGVVWTLVIIGIMLVVGLTVLSNLEETADETQAAAEALSTNQTYDNVTALTFTTPTILAYDDVLCTINNVTNATTTTQVIGSDNYTQTNCYLETTDAGQARADGGISANWNVSYSYIYDASTEASDAADSTISAVADIADWLPVIVVIIIAAVILGLVYFFRRSGE